MQEIAAATYNYQHFNEIMPTLYKRFTEKEPQYWRQIYKALSLLEYLIKNGAERVVDDARGRLSLLKSLRSFHYVDENGKDQGMNVKKRAAELVTLLSDTTMIKEERAKAKLNKSKYQGYSAGAGNSMGSSGSRYGGFGSDETPSFHRSRDVDTTARRREPEPARKVEKKVEKPVASLLDFGDDDAPLAKSVPTKAAQVDDDWGDFASAPVTFSKPPVDLFSAPPTNPAQPMDFFGSTAAPSKPTVDLFSAPPSYSSPTKSTQPMDLLLDGFDSLSISKPAAPMAPMAPMAATPTSPKQPTLSQMSTHPTTTFPQKNLSLDELWSANADLFSIANNNPTATGATFSSMMAQHGRKSSGSGFL